MCALQWPIDRPHGNEISDAFFLAASRPGHRGIGSRSDTEPSDLPAPDRRRRNSLHEGHLPQWVSAQPGRPAVQFRSALFVDSSTTSSASRGGHLLHRPHVARNGAIRLTRADGAETSTASASTASVHSPVPSRSSAARRRRPIANGLPARRFDAQSVRRNKPSRRSIVTEASHR